MADLDRLVLRPARAADAEAIAALHADSWRRHYRGAYSDAFLDGDVDTDRRSVWTDRLSHPRDGRHTVVAESDGAIIGFAHAVLQDDPIWGALLDNLHVTVSHQRRGIGARLLGLSAQVVVDNTPGSGLYLWVLEQNIAAQAFYNALGGRCVEEARARPVGGDPATLVGSPVKLRYAWSNPSVLRGAASAGS